MGHNSVVSGYPKSTEILRVDGWSTDPRVLGRHTRKKVKREDRVKEAFVYNFYFFYFYFFLYFFFNFH